METHKWKPYQCDHFQYMGSTYEIIFICLDNATIVLWDCMFSCMLTLLHLTCGNPEMKSSPGVTKFIIWHTTGINIYSCDYCFMIWKKKTILFTPDMWKYTNIKLYGLKQNQLSGPNSQIIFMDVDNAIMRFHFPISQKIILSVPEMLKHMDEKPY